MSKSLTNKEAFDRLNSSKLEVDLLADRFTRYFGRPVRNVEPAYTNLFTDSGGYGGAAILNFRLPFTQVLFVKRLNFFYHFSSSSTLASNFAFYTYLMKRGSPIPVKNILARKFNVPAGVTYESYQGNCNSFLMNGLCDIRNVTGTESQSSLTLEGYVISFDNEVFDIDPVGGADLRLGFTF